MFARDRIVLVVFLVVLGLWDVQALGDKRQSSHLYPRRSSIHPRGNHLYDHHWHVVQANARDVRPVIGNRYQMTKDVVDLATEDSENEIHKRDELGFDDDQDSEMNSMIMKQGRILSFEQALSNLVDTSDINIGNAKSIEEFAMVLKNVAAHQYSLEGNIKSTVALRRQIAKVFYQHLDELDIHNHNEVGRKYSQNQKVDILSHCIWAMGTLKMSKNDFMQSQRTVAAAGNDRSGDKTSINERIGSNNGVINDSVTADAATTAPVGYPQPSLLFQKWNRMMNVLSDMCAMDNGDSGAAATTMSRVQLFRSIFGLGKMGLRWSYMPAALRDYFIAQTSNTDRCTREAAEAEAESDGSKSNIDSDVRQDGGMDSITTTCTYTTPVTGLELSLALYLLGQIGAKNVELPPGYLQSLLRSLSNADLLKELTPRELFNALHGLSRLELRWEYDIPGKVVTAELVWYSGISIGVIALLVSASLVSFACMGRSPK